MCVRSIVKGSIPRTGDDFRLSGRALDRHRRVALKRLPELALQYPAGGFPGLRLEPNIHLEAIPAVRYAASRCRSSPGSAGRAVKGNSRTVARSNPHDHFRLTLHAPRSLGFAVDAARRAGYPWTEQMSRKLSRKVRETPSSSSQKRPERSAERPPTLWHQRQLVQDPVAPELDGRLVEISRDS